MKTNAQLEPERCEASLDPALTQRISATWTAMLARTRYADPSTRINLGDPTVVPDGVYHFMGREASGVAMWPSPRTRPGMLLAVVEALRDYCLKRGKDAVPLIERRVLTLERALRRV